MASPMETETDYNSKKSRATDEKRSVLILNEEWGIKKGGIATIHREISTTVKESGLETTVMAIRASDEDKADLAEKKIKLILPDTYSLKQPTLDWLALHQTYFPDLPKEAPKIDFIVGYGLITDTIALGMRKELGMRKSKVILIYYYIPEDMVLYKPYESDWKVAELEDRLLESATGIYAVVSIGPRVSDHFSNKFRAIRDKKLPKHIQFVPRPDEKFFDLKITKPEISDKTAWRVLVIGRVKGKEQLRGYDLVSEAMLQLSNFFRVIHRAPPKLIIRGVEEDENDETRTFFDKYRTGQLQIITLPYGTQDDILADLQQSHLCVMPSRSEPFGMVAFEAMAAGIPTIVTMNSGVADFVKNDDECKFHTYGHIVSVGFGGGRSRQEDVDTWEKAIRDVLCGYELAFNRAQELKKALKNSAAIKKSHEDFKRLFTK